MGWTAGIETVPFHVETVPYPGGHGRHPDAQPDADLRGEDLSGTSEQQLEAQLDVAGFSGRQDPAEGG